MEVATKTELQKNNTNTDYVTIVKTVSPLSLKIIEIIKFR